MKTFYGIPLPVLLKPFKTFLSILIQAQNHYSLFLQKKVTAKLIPRKELWEKLLCFTSLIVSPT